MNVEIVAVGQEHLVRYGGFTRTTVGEIGILPATFRCGGPIGR